MSKQTNINFHLTFKPEKQYIGSILDVANITTPMTVKDISSATGIPSGKNSGKVEPHIMYAKYMGLIESEKKDGMISLKRTKLGELVSLEDPGLHERLTILLCHIMMARGDAGADMWSVTFKQILPMYHSVIKKDMLIKELEQIYDGKANKKNVAPLISSYEDIFAELNLLSVDVEDIKINAMQFDKEYIYLYAYALFTYWDELYLNQEEISSIQLSELKYGKVFGWNEQEEYHVLESLADKGIIRLNRQLMPYTILRLADKDAVLERLYSELC